MFPFKLITILIISVLGYLIKSLKGSDSENNVSIDEDHSRMSGPFSHLNSVVSIEQGHNDSLPDFKQICVF